MPSVESIVMTSIKKRLQKSPLLSRDKEFLDSIKVSFFGGVLKVEYQDDDGNIVSVGESTQSSSESETESSSESTETVVKTSLQINTLISTKKQVIEDALEDSIPKILEKLLFS
jgi:hypothetical protein